MPKLKNSFRIWPYSAFERSSLIMTFGNPAAISGVEPVRRCAYEGCFTAALPIVPLA